MIQHAMPILTVLCVCRLGVFHKEDQIISVNGTYVKDLSLAGVVELLAKSGIRVKIEFLSVHALKEDGDDTALSGRYVLEIS